MSEDRTDPEPSLTEADRGGAGVDDDGHEDDDSDVVLMGLSWSRVVAVVLAFAWLAGVVGWFIGQRTSDPGPRSVDAGFYLDMIPHHDQAREMALIELQKGENATVRSFAQEIVIFQQYEIGLMDQTLAGWGLGQRDREPQAMEWMGMSVPYAEMPGLASEPQMEALRASSGAATDAMFLELMAEHHRGGVHMATLAARKAKDAGVRRLAAKMARNQSIEVNEFAQTAERYGFDVDIEKMDVVDP